MPSIDYLAIMPELILLGGALVILLATALVRGGLRRSTTTALATATGIGALIASLVEWARVSDQGSTTTIAHTFNTDWCRLSRARANRYSGISDLGIGGIVGRHHDGASKRSHCGVLSS